MGDDSLELLRVLHGDLLSVYNRKPRAFSVLEDENCLQLYASELESFWSPAAKSTADRQAVNSGKVTIDEVEFSLNDQFKQNAILLSDEAEINEIDAVRCLLRAQSSVADLGRSHMECALIELHRRRKYILEITRLFLELDGMTESQDGDSSDPYNIFINQYIFTSASQRIVPRCMTALENIKTWIQKLNDRLVAASILTSGASVFASTTTAPPGSNLAEYNTELQTIEFSRTSLYNQHELVCIIMSKAISKSQSHPDDFKFFFRHLSTIEKYDALLLHKIPILGAFISDFGSTEGRNEFLLARKLHEVACPTLSPTCQWTLPPLQAATRVWWLAEYGGYYTDDQSHVDVLPAGVDLEKEDEQRSQDLMEALKDGAFDFLLSVAADSKSLEWQDPARASMRQWLQRRIPALPSDSVPFSNPFQLALMARLEVFVDALISNLPDVLRKLRSDEDEQRQLSQNHEHDLNLERFLLIIAYAYEGRPDASMNFWNDPDSNLAGFMHWASRRASTPLVTAFCEMLQAISDGEECASSAHEFLLEDGQASSTLGNGSTSAMRLRKSLSLTWSQILRELAYFCTKLREKPGASGASTTATGGHGLVPGHHDPGSLGYSPQPISSSHPYGALRSSSGKQYPGGIAEIEPESAMMLECYLRLITKLASESVEARRYLLHQPQLNLIEILLHLASSPVPARLRACVFWAMGALVCHKSEEEERVLWDSVDSWAAGLFIPVRGTNVNAANLIVVNGMTSTAPPQPMERILEEISHGFEEPYAFIALLTALVAPCEPCSPLNDTLPFPEALGSFYRLSGMDGYVDYVLGVVFANRITELTDVNQKRMLRLRSIEFCLECLESFNEDLIIFGDASNIAIDSAIAATDLTTYVTLHPFARVMEWLLSEKVFTALYHTIHQPSLELSSAGPESPLVLGVTRTIELLCKALDLQSTYLNIVQQRVKAQRARHSKNTLSTPLYSSLDEGLVSHLSLIVDLGTFCSFGHDTLTAACLQLLKRMSVSQTVLSVCSGNSTGVHGMGLGHRNKAIVALEADGDHEAIARSFAADMALRLDVGAEDDSPNYQIKLHILDFLYACLRESPNKPTIAHLLLGFKCLATQLTIEANSAFEEGTSLYHRMVQLWNELPNADEASGTGNGGTRRWLMALKYKIIRVLDILWTSSLTAPLIVDELRQRGFPYVVLGQGGVIQQNTLWEGQSLYSADFPLTDGAQALLDMLGQRAIGLQYVAMELCRVVQSNMPSVKKQLFDALRGQVTMDGETIAIPTIFDLFDVLLPEGAWELEPPSLSFYRGINFDACREKDAEGNTIMNLERVRELLLLKRSEGRDRAALVSAQDLTDMDNEEFILLEYFLSANRRTQLAAAAAKALQSWTNLVLVMIESNELEGTAQASLYLQTLQTVLPGLEVFAEERPHIALELTKLAKVLLFKLDMAQSANSDGQTNSTSSVGHLVGDKLYQLFEICLQAVGKCGEWAELRAVYYSIAYRYLTSIVDTATPATMKDLRKTTSAVRTYGDRLANTICDDAYGGDATCQTAALILLSALLQLDVVDDGGAHVIDSLQRINFIGVLVDSLRTIREDELSSLAETTSAMNRLSSNNLGPGSAHLFSPECLRDHQRSQHQKYVLDAKLGLLQQIAQSREGAKYLFHANILHAVEASGLFSLDPELHFTQDKEAAPGRGGTSSGGGDVALARHYRVLASLARIVGAAIVSRGSQSLHLGLRFLTEHRMLVTHTLKRASASNNSSMDDDVRVAVRELADALVVLLTATHFLEVDEETLSPQKSSSLRFH